MGSDSSSSDRLSPSKPPDLDGSTVHLWLMDLQVPESRRSGWWNVLSKSEQDRCSKFRTHQLQDRYLAAHAQLRILLGKYLQTEPASLEFLVGQQGKPFIPGNPIHFNLSHSLDYGLIGVTRAGPLGVDVEHCSRKVEARGIAERFFSPREWETLKDLPEDQQHPAFFRLWTRKEAWLKANGLGIGDGLNRIEFNCVSNEPPRLLRMHGDEVKASQWTIHSFEHPNGVIAAAAIEKQGVRWKEFRIP